MHVKLGANITQLHTDREETDPWADTTASSIEPATQTEDNAEEQCGTEQQNDTEPTESAQPRTFNEQAANASEKEEGTFMYN